MASRSDVKPLAEVIGAPILKAYQAGSAGLVLVCMGTLLLLAALFWGAGILRYLLATVGTCMVFLVLVLFYLQDIRKLKQASESIESNRDLVNAIQQTAIEMTTLASNFQSLAFRHADEVTFLVNMFRERLRSRNSASHNTSTTPSIDRLVEFTDNLYIVQVENHSASIVSTTESAKIVLEDIRNALIESNPTLLKRYLAEIQELDIKTQVLLSDQFNLTHQRDKAC
jgi:ABC-type multidrug transport system fused ATPase/permease subunit